MMGYVWEENVSNIKVIDVKELIFIIEYNEHWSTKYEID